MSAKIVKIFFLTAVVLSVVNCSDSTYSQKGTPETQYDASGRQVIDVSQNGLVDPTDELDDSAGVQAEVNNLHAAGGGVLYFPAGKYIIAGIELYPNIIIRGEGIDATILELPVNDEKHEMFKSASGIEQKNISFENLTMTAAFRDTTLYTMIYNDVTKEYEKIFTYEAPMGVSLSGGTINDVAVNVFLNNCKFSGFYSSNHEVDQLDVTPAAIQGRYDNLKINNCIFNMDRTENVPEGYVMYSYLMYLVKAKNISVTNSTFNTDLEGNCIYTMACQNITVNGNTFQVFDQNARVEAIDLEGASNIIISNNRFLDISVDGVLIGQNADVPSGYSGNCSDIVISDNIFTNIGNTGAGRSAVTVMGYNGTLGVNYISRVKIDSNIIYNCRNGVQVGNAGQNNPAIIAVQNNWIDDCDYDLYLIGNAYSVTFTANRLIGVAGRHEETGVLIEKDSIVN